MKVTCIISFVVCLVLGLLFAFSWFDIVQLDPTVRSILGSVCLVVLVIFLKTYVRLRKSTRRFW